MGAMTDYLVDAVLDDLFRSSAYSKPANYYVGLTVSGTEVSGGSYARVAVAKGDASFTAPASRGVKNAGTITFPAPTGNWGTVDGAAIWDASSGGNKLISGTLTTPRTINNGDGAPSFQANQLVFTFT